MRHGGMGILLAALLGALAGCEGPRALLMVRESGDRAFSRQEYPKALTEYTEIVERAPADWESRVKLARTQLVLNDATAARENLAVAHSMRPDDDNIVDLLSTAMLESGQVTQMHDLLEQRARTKGRTGDYLRLGFFMDRAGDADSAERALLTAARIDRGQHIEPYLALADFYHKVGDDDAALRRLRYALWIDSTNDAVIARLRDMGEIPGPSLALQPPN